MAQLRMKYYATNRNRTLKLKYTCLYLQSNALYFGPFVFGLISLFICTCMITQHDDKRNDRAE